MRVRFRYPGRRAVPWACGRSPATAALPTPPAPPPRLAPPHPAPFRRGRPPRPRPLPAAPRRNPGTRTAPHRSPQPHIARRTGVTVSSRYASSASTMRGNWHTGIRSMHRGEWARAEVGEGTVCGARRAGTALRTWSRRARRARRAQRVARAGRRARLPYAGVMFALSRNRFPGSTWALSARSRSRVAGGKAAASCAGPCSVSKLR